MKVLHTVSGIWKHTGGPAESLPLLCKYMLPFETKLSIATLSGDNSDTTINVEKMGVDVYNFPLSFGFSPRYSSSMRRGLPLLIKDTDIVHSHSLWEYTNWFTCSESIRQKKPYLISFHGTITNVQQNWRLKLVYLKIRRISSKR